MRQPIRAAMSLLTRPDGRIAAGGQSALRSLTRPDIATTPALPRWSDAAGVASAESKPEAQACEAHLHGRPEP
jgi:hypothetical protein